MRSGQSRDTFLSGGAPATPVCPAAVPNDDEGSAIGGSGPFRQGGSIYMLAACKCSQHAQRELTHRRGAGLRRRVEFNSLNRQDWVQLTCLQLYIEHDTGGCPPRPTASPDKAPPA